MREERPYVLAVPTCPAHPTALGAPHGGGGPTHARRVTSAAPLAGAGRTVVVRPCGGGNKSSPGCVNVNTPLNTLTTRNALPTSRRGRSL